MSYQLTILDKTATVDSYEEGEIGPENNFYINEKITGETVKEVIEKACDFVGGEFNGVNQCYSTDIDGDLGRIDFQTMEDAAAMSVSESDLELWKQGKKQLYACYYVGIVEEVTPVNLLKAMEVTA